ncbi:MAG: alanyl-tRNA editing protein [Treponema sp.]|jgi:alanyl-tRNA synthetase|nr:alanyl-tRNA editing protein [Treponema sp.]
MRTKPDYYDIDLYGDGKAQAEICEIRSRGGTKAAVLDRTIFYPEGGGQGADRGTINGCAVLDVKEEDGEILHILSGDCALVPGPCELVLDISRRRDFTVQHTAQHLVSGIMLRLAGYPTVSMHLGEAYTTIDVDGKNISRETLLEVEDEAAAAVERNVPVIIHLCPPERVEDFPLRKIPPKGEDVIRVVEINGYDFSPCCGTHVSGAAQIGMIRILGSEKYKGMTRVHLIAGRRCLKDSRALRENAEAISRALSVPVEETGAAALALLEKAGKMEERLEALAEEAARIKACAIIEKAELEGAGPGVWHTEYFPAADMEEVTSLGRQLRELSGAVFVLGAGEDRKFAALCSAEGTDIRPKLKEALEKAGGKGGGGKDFFQGQFASCDELKAFLAGLRADVRT